MGFGQWNFHGSDFTTIYLKMSRGFHCLFNQFGYSWAREANGLIEQIHLRQKENEFETQRQSLFVKIRELYQRRVDHSHIWTRKREDGIDDTNKNLIALKYPSSFEQINDAIQKIEAQDDLAIQNYERRKDSDEIKEIESLIEEVGIIENEYADQTPQWIREIKEKLIDIKDDYLCSKTTCIATIIFAFKGQQ